ncbi:MAG: hypothetical protein JWM87_3212 [Candidatus Eremiobacteraeota bacterium]|nr:hypothetical protein [Candidatus Eremiobacteraeota bacterium]
MISFNLTAAIRGGAALAAFIPATVSAAPAPVTMAAAAAPAAAVSSRAADARSVADLDAAIKASSIVYKGKLYPALKTPSSGAAHKSSSAAASQNASCPIGSTIAFDQGAAIDLEGGNHKPTNQTWGPDEEVYSPPNPDYVIQSFGRTVSTAGGTYNAGTSQMPPNYSFTNSINYSTATNDLHNYVLSLNIPDVVKANLNTTINNTFSNYQSYAQTLGASAGTVKHHAQVWGTGVFNTSQGHSWYHGYIGGTLICAPAYLHDQALLEAGMKAWVNAVVSRLPRRLEESAKTSL